MQSISDLTFKNQLVIVTVILLTMYIFAVVPKAVQLVKMLAKNKSILKKILLGLFFVISVSADLTIVILAIHGLVYFLKS